jgi:signal transduction histidine kinase
MSKGIFSGPNEREAYPAAAGELLTPYSNETPPMKTMHTKMQVDPVTNIARNARILVVDDEMNNIAALSNILARAGYNDCICFTDPSQALAQFASINPDLLLLDWHMTPISGLEFIESLKTTVSPEEMPPVLVLTADNATETRREALALGASDFLSKPLDPSEILLRIRNLLHIYLLHWRLLESQRHLEGEVRERTCQLEQALTDLQATQQQVIQQERLRALGVMAAGVAHDFNNALMIITGYSEIFTRKPECYNDPEEVRMALDAINGAAANASNTVNRLREFYRPYCKEEEERQPTDINALVRESVQLTRPRWESESQAKGLTIEVKMRLGNPPFISASAPELREAMVNLIFNAVDAMPQGGAIIISTGVEEEYVFFTLEDNGTGMTEETRRRCLEPFYTTKGSQGTGLGLAIVYGMVSRHSGLIRVNTEVNQGTQFSIFLPLTETCQSEAHERTPDVSVTRPLNVLVVDDQPEIRRVLSICLECDAHRVVTAENGCDAIEKFRAGKFDVVITDRAMPKMNGEKLAAAIKEMVPGEPVILLTAFAENGKRMPDVDYVLSKPASLRTIREAIGKVLLETKEEKK